jgi:predicted phage-related endonuclease
MLDAPQGSPAWLQARLGRATASRVSDIVAKAKNGTWYATREKYMAELVAERLTGVPYPGYVSASMQWGTDTQPQAEAEYAFVADVDITPVGFVEHPRIAMSGASPDGLIGDDGLVEYKCPDSHTHIATLLGEAIPAAYLTQMQFQMSCTGRHYCDWVSFDPRLPDYARLHIHRVYRDDEYIAELENEVRIFLIEVDKKTERVRALGAK